MAASAGPIRICGNLKKRSYGWIYNADQDRYFVLSGTSLRHWYDSRPATVEGPPRRTMDLSLAKSIIPDPENVLQFTVEWDDPGMPMYLLFASSESERDQWVEALLDVARSPDARTTALRRRLGAVATGQETLLFQNDCAARDRCLFLVEASVGRQRDAIGRPVAVQLTDKWLRWLPHDADPAATAWQLAQRGEPVQLPIQALEDPREGRLERFWGLNHLDDATSVLIRTPEVANPDLVSAAMDSGLAVQDLIGRTAALRFRRVDEATQVRQLLGDRIQGKQLPGPDNSLGRSMLPPVPSHQPDDSGGAAASPALKPTPAIVDVSGQLIASDFQRPPAAAADGAAARAPLPAAPAVVPVSPAEVHPAPDEPAAPTPEHDRMAAAVADLLAEGCPAEIVQAAQQVCGDDVEMLQEAVRAEWKNREPEPEPPAGERYAAELDELERRGFNDRARLAALLEIVRGDVEQAAVYAADSS
eukprot:TRINITY_DN5137_c0_g1_i1.p1 TRINITY_DN5137_c0_g1~~TRINITY_DN5137_c0_g1_i1.p1  ORF type:complete len:502 (+),score=133.10 TRINITY_DN5137_c0_g1_i1:83-1507(+)